MTSSEQPPLAPASPRYLLVADGQLLCTSDEQLVLLDPAQRAEWPAHAPEDVLGDWGGRPLRLVSLLPETSRPLEQLPGLREGRWLGLRALLGRVPDALFMLAGSGLQWYRWRREHRFCGRCGASTEPMPAGEPAHQCPECGLRFYPRVTPCMITLVTRGDHCLLARHARSTSATFTALAGFVEIGERVEDTVHREVKEEVGLGVHPPRYFDSQPWPFPGQLMLGFHAEYRSGDIRVDGDEIVEAHWYHYQSLPDIPPPQTLAGQLIADFVRRQHNGPQPLSQRAGDP